MSSDLDSPRHGSLSEDGLYDTYDENLALLDKDTMERQEGCYNEPQNVRGSRQMVLAVALSLLMLVYVTMLSTFESSFHSSKGLPVMEMSHGKIEVKSQSSLIFFCAC